MSIRTTQPSNTNKYYLTTAGGGYNKCILGNANNKYNKRPASYSVLPNCVGYAYGRYLEYWGLKSANLPTCNAKDWDNVAKANGFNVSKTPSVGSVIVFEGTECGHVAFVEEIKSNGDLLLSESNWSYSIFRNVTVKKANDYRYSSTLKCVGFVANSNAPKSTTAKKTVTEIAKEVIDGKWSVGSDRKAKLKAAGYDYDEVQKEVNKILNSSTNNTKTVKVGSKVKVKKGAKTYTGGSLQSWVYDTTFSVLSLNKDRIVIGLNGKTTAAVNAKDLTIV